MSSTKHKEWVEANRERLNKKQAEKQREKTQDPEKRKARNEYRRQYHKDNPDVTKAAHLRKYKLTLEQYNDLKAQQDYRCRICKTHESEMKYQLSVDHCHATSKVRGLLCNNCNPGLGKFKDSIQLLEEAIIYLKETR